MSDIPARNDILRLDEMMSRKPDWIDTYRLAIYFISIRYRYLLQITGVTLMRSHAILTGLLCCFLFYSQRRPG